MLMRLIGAPCVSRVALTLSNGFCAIIVGVWLGASLEAHQESERRETLRLERTLREHTAQKLIAHTNAHNHDRETVCLANIVHHEARGELRGVRRLIALVVLAMRDDPSWIGTRTVCGLAKQPRLFSQLKDVDVPHFEKAAWFENYLLAQEVYQTVWRHQLLPQGWGCVRGFKISDEYLASLDQKRRAQLGITSEAKGIRYFREKRQAVDTRGRFTFYREKGACNPLPTT